MALEKSDKLKIYYALFFPTLICLMEILIFVFEKGMGYDFTEAGIFPREPKTLFHIFSLPLVHADWSHLFNNVVSFFVLGACLYYFYSEIANKILLLSLIISGLLLWVIGRENWHIGLSGVIFSVSFFLFFSGVIRKHIPLIAISLIIVFLYGNNVWHLFPWQKLDPVSWEGHLSGAATGILLALLFRKDGPQKPDDLWDDDDDDDADDDVNADEKGDEEQKYETKTSNIR